MEITPENIVVIYVERPQDFQVINVSDWVYEGGERFRSKIVKHSESGNQLCIPEIESI